MIGHIELVKVIPTQKLNKNVKASLFASQHLDIEPVCFVQKRTLKRGVIVHLDLTKRSHKLLQGANSSVKDNGEVKFCYTDVNLRLKVNWNDDSQEDNFFSSRNELDDRLYGN